VLTADGAGSRGYRWFVLGLFTLVYVLNFVDRQIIVILGPSLKAELNVGDAELGLLFGTAFALFYALFGLPLARLVDGWNRVATLTMGLLVWSATTTMSAFVGSYGQLAALRTLVGIGEASASPAAFSILQDYFPPKQRATALAIYGSGIYIGIGVSLAMGGGILAYWGGYAPGARPFGLEGWQAAYLAAGLPGIVLALLIALTVREPARGASEGLARPREPGAIRGLPIDLGLFVPILATFLLKRLGAPPAVVRRHAMLLILLPIAALAIVTVTDPLLAESKRVAIAHPFGLPLTTNMVQWIALAIGAHAAFGWIAALRLRSPEAAKATVDNPVFRLLSIGGGVISIAGYGMTTFVFVYGKQNLGLTAADGIILGAISCVAGGSGTILGGVLADRSARSGPEARLYVAIAAVTFAAAGYLWMLTTPSVPQFYVANFMAQLALAMWLGPVFAAGQEEVGPSQRGTATGLQFLATNLIGLGLGPYCVGLASDASGDLRSAMLASLLAVPAAIALFWRAARLLEIR
jgi:MFS family permease